MKGKAFAAVVCGVFLSVVACKEEAKGPVPVQSSNRTSKNVGAAGGSSVGIAQSSSVQKVLLRKVIVPGDYHLPGLMSRMLVGGKIDFRKNNCVQFVRVQRGGSTQDMLEIFDQPCPADGSAIQTDAKIPLVATELPQDKIASNVHKFELNYWYHGIPYLVGRLEAYGTNPIEGYLKGLCQFVEEADDSETGFPARCTITYDATGQILSLELP